MSKTLIRPAGCLLALMAVLPAQAQLADNFNDSNFTANPPWTGNTGDWIVNAAKRLQSNNSIANSTFYLSTPSTLAGSAQWELYTQLAFNTSSANYADVYLTASDGNLTEVNTTGYFVRLGNTSDDICLYRRDFFGVAVLLIDGADGILNTSNNTVKIKVIRDAHNEWTLYRDLSGTGNNYVSEGSATDSTYKSSAFFGLFIRQSTASFFQKHFFDDIEVKSYAPDTIPPALVSAASTTNTTLDIVFNEPVEAASSQATANYFSDNGIGNPMSATRDATNNALVHLLFKNPFPNGINCRLMVNHVKDLAGNALINGTASFSFYTVQSRDVIIDEIMADPNPPVGLPAYEFVELKNVSAHTLDLYGWQVGDSTGFATINTHFLLPPDSLLIVTGNTAAPVFTIYGTTLGVGSFPTLNNDGDQLYLRSKEGRTIHAVAYTSSWYHNDIKSKGGWSLEMIDTQNPCSGSANWTASTNARGGTPGRKNSADGINKDTRPPVLTAAFASDSSTLSLLFDEPLDSLNAATAARYNINFGIGVPQSAIAIAPLFNTVQLKLSTPLKEGIIYTITATGTADCSGNTIAGPDTVRVALTVMPDTLDVVINELLFNPRPGGADYVELYNRSNKTINLADCYIANRAANGAIGSEKAISTTSRLLFPQDYLVVTEDPIAVQQQYLCKNPGAFATIATMPSYPNDRGDVVVLNSRGAIIDELQYDENWQFKLIANDEGVALERIDYNNPTQDAANWHSAATNTGYGTPTYQNSQYHEAPQAAGTIAVAPAIFSPDNDGVDDWATISYQFPNPGYVCNITVFDAVGRPVRYLTHNALCGLSGYFRWDGLDEHNRKLSIGVYVVYTEVFNLTGDTRRWKQAITLARRF